MILTEYIEWFCIYIIVCGYIFMTFGFTFMLETLIVIKPYMYLVMRSSMIYWQILGSPPLPKYMSSELDRVKVWIYYAMKRHDIFSISGFKNTYDRPVILLYHPHGIFVISMLLTRFSPHMNNMCGCVANIFKPLMGIKIIDLFFGNCCVTSSADKCNMARIMKLQRNLTVCPGGFEEALLHRHDANVLYLKKRMGFIKLCLVHGYHPVIWFAFGDNHTYYNLQIFTRFRLWLSKFGIPGVLPIGRFLIFPRTLKLRNVVSDPIIMPHIPNPTDKDVVKYHDMYLLKLREFYEKHKTPIDGDLIIV